MLYECGDIGRRDRLVVALEGNFYRREGEHICRNRKQDPQGLWGSGYEITKQDGTVTESQPLLPSAFFTIEKAGMFLSSMAAGMGTESA